MTPLLDVEHLRVVYHRPYISVLVRSLCKRQQTVHSGYQVGVDLYLWNIFLHGNNQLIEKLRFQDQYLLICTENFLLIFLQFLSDVTFCLRQSLLANPVFRHLVLKGITNLEIITKDIVIAHFKARYTRLLYLPLLYLEQIVLSMSADSTQVVQFGMIAIGYNISLINQLRRIGLYLLGDAFPQRITQIELLSHSSQSLILGMLASCLDRPNGFQGMLQLHNLTWRNSAHGNLGNNTFQVAYAMQLFIQQLTEFWLFEEIFHDVESLIDRAYILQREYKPSAEHTSTHGRYRAVDNIQQRRTILLHRSYKFQTTYGEAVHAYKLVFLYAREGRDMVNLGMLSNLKILHDGTAGDNTILQVFHAKALQRLGLEMPQQFLASCLFCKHPVVQFESTVFDTESLLKLRLHGAVIKHLFRLKICHQFLHIIGSSLSCQELSCRDIEESHTAGRLSEVHGSKKVVFLVVQHIIAHGHTRCHQFGNATLHHLVHLAQSFLALYFLTLLLRVFQLVANSHALTSPYQLGQISVESMMRETSHLCSTCRTAIVTTCQRDAENPGSLYRILAICFIEVATSEEQQCLGMLCLHLEKLPHHGRQTFIVVCHCLFPVLIYLSRNGYAMTFPAVSSELQKYEKMRRKQNDSTLI